MESHRNFFHDVHGVPRTMVYDNMKVAVILKPDGKKPTEKMRELFRVHFEDNGKDFLKLLKYCREKSYDYKDILDAVRKIRMRGARHINFDQIKVALEKV